MLPGKMPPGKIPPGKLPLENPPQGKLPPENCPPKIILWILFVSNLFFIEIFDQKLKLIFLNIF